MKNEILNYDYKVFKVFIEIFKKNFKNEDEYLNKRDVNKHTTLKTKNELQMEDISEMMSLASSIVNNIYKQV